MPRAKRVTRNPTSRITKATTLDKAQVIIERDLSLLTGGELPERQVEAENEIRTGATG